MKLFINAGRGNGKSLRTFEEVAEIAEELLPVSAEAAKMLVSETAALDAKVQPTPEFVEAVKELAKRIGEAAAELVEAFKDFLAENIASLEIAEKLEEYAKYYREERFDLTREEWREAEAFASQKAAARARSYAGSLTMEKAREVRRRRKWRKRIDDRIHIVRG